MDTEQILGKFYLELRSRLLDAQSLEYFDDEAVESWRRAGLYPDLMLPRLQLTSPDPESNAWRTCVAFDAQTVDHWFTDSQAIFFANVEWGPLESGSTSILPSLGNCVGGHGGLLGVFRALLSTADSASTGTGVQRRTGDFIAIDGHPVWEATALRVGREVNVPLQYDETFLSHPDVMLDRDAGLAQCLPRELKSPFFLRAGAAISASVGWLALVYGLKFVVDRWQEINDVLANADLPGFVYSQDVWLPGHQFRADHGGPENLKIQEDSRLEHVKKEAAYTGVEQPGRPDTESDEALTKPERHQGAAVAGPNLSQFTAIPLVNSGLFSPNDRWAEVSVQDLEVQSGVCRVFGSSWSSFDSDGDIVDEYDQEDPYFSLVLISDKVHGLQLWSAQVGQSWVGSRLAEESDPVNPMKTGCWGGRYVVGHDLQPGRYLLTPSDSGKIHFRLFNQQLEELPQRATYTSPGDSRHVEIEPEAFAVEFRGTLRPIE